MRPLLILLIVTLSSSIAAGIDFESGITTSINTTELQKTPKKDWPKHEAPIALNDWFEVPTSVWKVHGGHFIFYDAGEWGGALFFQPKGKNKLRLLLKGYVNSVVIIGDGNYIAAGGLAHGIERGYIYRIWVDEDVKWQTKQLLSTSAGIATILGITGGRSALVSITRRELILGESEKQITVSLFKVHPDGGIEYLGQPTKEKKRTIESSEPPPRPELKSQ